MAQDQGHAKSVKNTKIAQQKDQKVAKNKRHLLAKNKRHLRNHRCVWQTSITLFEACLLHLSSGQKVQWAK